MLYKVFCITTELRSVCCGLTKQLSHSDIDGDQKILNTSQFSYCFLKLTNYMYKLYIYIYIYICRYYIGKCKCIGVIYINIYIYIYILNIYNIYNNIYYIYNNIYNNIYYIYNMIHKFGVWLQNL